MTSKSGYVDMWHIMEALQTRYLLTQEMMNAILRTDCNDSSPTKKNLAAEVKGLLDKGADADGMPGASMLRPLHAAAKMGRSDVMELLIDAEADVNTVDAYNNRAPLHYAAEANSSAVQILLKHGALPDVHDADGNTPLHWASYKNNIGCVKCLLLNNAAVNARNVNYDTPLSFAAMKGNCHCVRLLLDYGADVRLRNASGKTALYRAATMQYSELNSFEDDVCFDLLFRASGRLLLDPDGLEEPEISQSERDMYRFLVTIAAQVPSLSSLCRSSIRQRLVNRYLPDAVELLRLPAEMKKFLLLRGKR